jgi:hypothetical protein
MYIFSSRLKLLEAYNQSAGTDYCIRTLDNRIRELVEADQLKRWPRLKSMGVSGNRFISSGSSLTKKGLKALEWFGIRAFDKIKKIRQAILDKKEKARFAVVERASSVSATKLGSIVKEELNKLKPS